MRLTRWFLGAAFAAAFLLPMAAKAQSQGAVPPEVAALFDQISDIDKLRVLNPLKLTPDQIDQLISLIQTQMKDYDKKLADAAVPPIREIAADIKETRRKMLSGASVPKDFDQKVRQIQDDFVKRKQQANQELIDSMAAATRKILTEAQVALAAKTAREATAAALKKDVPGTDAQFFNLYVANTFIVYPRTVQLLKDVKAASSPTTTSSAAPVLREARR